MRKALILVLLAFGCKKDLPPEHAYDAGQHETALQRQQELAMLEGREQALHSLRLASMAHAQGDLDLAEKALRVAVVQMQDFTAEGEFRALVGREQAKEWKGEPYEKLAAFLDLGLLLHQEGDLGNALAMYKSAVISDAGSTEERYRSDFVAGYVLQALAYAAEREQGNAEQALGRGIDALYARRLTAMLSDALDDVPGEGHYEDVQNARVLLRTGLPAGLTVAARDPVEAVRAAKSQATDIANAHRNLPKKERLPELQRWSDKDFTHALQAMEALSAGWSEKAAEIPPGVLAALAQRAEELEELLEDPPNVVLVVERGKGPRKVQTGQYGELLQLRPGKSPGGPLPVTVDGRTLTLDELDSYSYQATTRGSRAVDGFLRGKAVYKDTSFATAWILAEAGDIANYADNQNLALALYLISAGVFVTGALTTPEADAREWGLMPDQLYLVPLRVEPGEHALTVNGRSYTVVAPPTGQLVARVPALAPGGPNRIEAR